MGVIADTELDQGWIWENAQTDAPMRHSSTRPICQACNWSRAGSGAGSLASNPSLPCGFSLAWSETDQYMDPWSDLSLSLDPTTRDRQGYAGGNPVSNVDLDGHAFTPGGCYQQSCSDDAHDPPDRLPNHAGKQQNLLDNPTRDQGCYNCHDRNPITVKQADDARGLAQLTLLDAEANAAEAADAAERWEDWNTALDAAMFVEISTCAAGCQGLVALPFTAVGRGATGLLGRSAIKASGRANVKLVTAGRSGSSDAALGALIRTDARLTYKYGAAGRRVLQDGRIRYYGRLTSAKRAGETAGRRYVKEWDPSSGAIRSWHESLNHSGGVVQVRLQQPYRSPHYRFDGKGGFRPNETW